MREQIEILANLQNVDREIREKNNIKQELLADLQAQEQEIQSKKQEIAWLAAAYAEKERERQEKERFLQDEGKKAMDKRMRMNRIKNAKELQALQREIDQIKQSNGDVEEDLIRIFEEIDRIKAELKSKEEEVATLQREWQQKQEEMQTKISGIDQLVSDAVTLRKTIASQIAGELISRYELIFARRGGSAVVEVSGGICQGCYMNIPPQLWNEIIKSEKVNLCPSCQRILYYKPSAQQEKEA
ncbi:MAG TPA: C4-type zinc ribbon domain-containing protein [Candidatus Binatia bacterium]|nr:C4-type zinc ribbon domain-containing protein [Candidatus Binatia bacterium]